ncbi:hypothetical protein GCM10008025_02700 [Ornithinibacillus halotolerans]|uniref:FbpB family small basic protein n=1 Tax=Ornithinibacillus halotolerans TaxID=1274357 RepID=A0A916RNV8_9BACI|nr:FbpB family small basic protein [Ornithinibacillus halotolerans]GGA62206.1 hypothetical protein GCM10008025_02700 [Ornithinibacillus halotolerans]
MKKRHSFEELVQANRQQILEDRDFLDRFEDNLERRAKELLEKKKEA